MDINDSRNSMSSKQERLIVCPKRKQSKWDDKNQNKVKVKLEHVLGLTVTSNAALDCDSKTGIIAYPAGCTIVFLSPYREKQSHLLNDSRKSVTCLTYSPDGRFLATGEYGHQPSIRIWDLSDNTKCCEFSDHKCGINCLVFSPNQKYLVSVGSQHDMIINVWDWRSRIKIGANKVSTKIKAVAFCETGDYFVTVGNRHVKFWYIQHSKQSLNKDQPGLIGRAAILGEQQNNDFVDVVCGKGNFQDMTYVITRSGILCEFNGRRLLDRWVNVKTSCAFCITAGEEYLFIGCAESIIRCFSLSSLAFVTTLPRTHYLGVDVSRALNIAHTATHPKDARYPDTIAVVYDETHKKLACVYNDHSLYIWDIHDIKKVGKSNSYLYHCACIWGVETYPNIENSAIPPGSFITCSSDDTIRFWNLDKHKNNFSADSAYQSNIYSNELMKVIYIDPELQYIKNTDIGLTDKTENVSYDDRNGVRSMGISPDGQQLATGDRSGNIRVYGLKNVEEVCKIEAHDAEVLCLEYAPVIPNSNKRLLLSASRDRLIHVFDASDYYKFVETLDDHSSSITAIRFIDMNGQLQLVSCSADKSIIFRRYQLQGKNGHFVRDRLLAGKSTLYDMAVDCSQKYILTACQDRYIRVYNVNNGKQCKNFKGSVGEDGSVIKVALDSSGRYLATSCTDKTLCIFDYYSGECIASMCGHSELVTGLRFSNDCERLVSASGDGCIFVWRLPRDMVVTMQTRMAQQRARSMYENPEDQMNEIMISSHLKQDIGRDLNSDMRFNDGQLPLWVTKTENEESSLISNANTRKMMPKGRWAQRITPFPQDGIFHLPSGRESDGSKEDSSVDSGTETSRPEDRHEKLIVPQKMIRSPPKFITVDDSTDRMDLNNTDKGMYRRSNTQNISDIQDMHRMRQHTDDSSLGSFKNEDLESTEHDGDIEDYSEVESAENEPNNKVMYYETVDDALSEFKVNAIDADELRKSQRKMKRNALAKKNPTLDIAAYSVSGSQESDDDDDEGGSTPSADNSEKANSLSLSSVDAFIQREKYLKGTYESLSGMEMDMKHNSEYQDKKHTISSQHHSFNSDYKNQKIIQATIQTKNDLEANRKRQELQSRLEDIRGKLECAGHSSLKSSQSTMDLRRNETYFVPMSIHKPNNDFQVTDNGDVGMRRSCSLSDLSGSSMLVSPNNQKKYGDKYSSYKNQDSGLHSSTPFSSPISRSSSEIALMPPPSHYRRPSRGENNSTSQRVMRPTISSQNKIKSNASSMKSNSNLARRRQSGSLSYMALNDVSNMEDSSSEDNKSDRPRNSAVFSDKQTLNKRSSKFLERSCSERDLSALSYLANKKRNHQLNEAKSEAQLLGSTFLDVNNQPLLNFSVSRDLLNTVVEQFKKTAENIIRIHDRIAVENMNDAEKKMLLLSLRNTIGQVQNNLRSKFEPGDMMQNELVNNDNTPKSNNSDDMRLPSDNMVSMIQQYSDVLVSIVQQKFDQKP
ncbi:WD repeat-containing protein 62 isoform X3 [Planococcus citri]|uniref:WD repeat-containing protein 62 isoform X3 n=1 Tax=Planococcus citri TaxID=170843 RepID=UPI0031F73DEC